MSGATPSVVRGLTAFLLCALTPQLLRAQVSPFVDPDLSLGSLTPPHGAPNVGSSAKATLFDASTGQRLISQVIMGHGVADITTQTEIYQKRVVSDTGDARNQATLWKPRWCKPIR